jgi:hypothetical protein
MSKIIATYNLDTKTWNVESNIEESHCDLEFKFIENNAELVEFENLTVGYELYQDGIDFKIQSYLYSPLHYDMSRSIALTLGQGVGYKLVLWVISGGTTEYTFSTPTGNEV